MPQRNAARAGGDEWPDDLWPGGLSSRDSAGSQPVLSRRAENSLNSGCASKGTCRPGEVVACGCW
jgi:hypothetical protein